MCHLTHAVMYANHVVYYSRDKSMFGEFVEDSDLEKVEKENGYESEEEEEMIV